MIVEEVIGGVEYDYFSSIPDLILYILRVVYELAPVVLLLFIAIMVWRMYQMQKEIHRQKKQDK